MKSLALLYEYDSVIAKRFRSVFTNLSCYSHIMKSILLRKFKKPSEKIIALLYQVIA